MLPGARGLRGPLSCFNEARYGIVWDAIAAPSSGLPKDEIAQPLRLLLSEAPQLVHRGGAPALVTDQGIAGVA
jgi:hypothetical protein